MNTPRRIAGCRFAAPKFVLLVGAIVAQTSCNTITDLGEDRPGAKRLRFNVDGAAWSADSRTIYFLEPSSPNEVYAVSVGSWGRRRLASLADYHGAGEGVQTTLDLSAVYVALKTGAQTFQYEIYRVPSAGGVLDTVTTNAASPAFAVSASGNRLAYMGPRLSSDTIQVVTLTNGRPASRTSFRTIVREPRIVGLSPDGVRVLYRDDAGVYSAPVTSGTHQQLMRIPRSAAADSVTRLAAQIQWEGNTPHLLIGTSTLESGLQRTMLIQDVNGSTGVRAPRALVPGVLSAPWSLARSRDGRSIAAWVPVTEEQRPNAYDDFYNFRLYIQTPRTTAPVAVLEWVSYHGFEWLEFSPDGRWLALILTGGLYVVDLKRWT